MDLKTSKAQLLELISKLPSSGDEITETDRKKTLQALDDMRQVLEPPDLAIQRLIFAPHALTAVQIALSMGIFATFHAFNFAPTDAAGLARATDGDSALIVRIMRMLIASGLFLQTDDRRYTALPLARVIATQPSASGAITHFYQHLVVFAKMDEYFRATHFANPTDPKAAPFQFAMDTTQHAFDYIALRPDWQQPFNDAMAGMHRLRGEDWFGYFPVEQKLLHRPDGPGPERFLFVDIGGGKGQDIAALVARFPQLKDRVLLQELPSVVRDIGEPPPGVQVQPYDLFTPQPVRGARAYYLRSVFHDFPDRLVAQALAIVHEAMDGDSILLVYETTVPEVGAPGICAQIDMTMMAAFSALERTQAQWEQLLTGAGFHVQMVWRGPGEEQKMSALFEATKV